MNSSKNHKKNIARTPDLSANQTVSERTGSDSDKIRLSKVMADRGICSRREADAYISDGCVMVDGIVIKELGTKIRQDARITLDERALRAQKGLVSVILNKPIGYVLAHPEKGYEPSIRLLTPDNEWKGRSQTVDQSLAQRQSSSVKDPSRLTGLAVAGRLDIDSQGILLFTQDGRLARKLIGENERTEKEYLVRVQGVLPKSELAKLRFGLALDGKPLRTAQVDWINEDQLRFVLTEGRKRQIRRMCELVGLKVLGLKRVRVGNLVLGALPEGQWRHLTPKETAELTKLV